MLPFDDFFKSVYGNSNVLTMHINGYTIVTAHTKEYDCLETYALFLDVVILICEHVY